jgi:hypothetical protein
VSARQLASGRLHLSDSEDVCAHRGAVWREELLKALPLETCLVAAFGLLGRRWDDERKDTSAVIEEEVLSV